MTTNATVTVTLAGQSLSFDLEPNELSTDSVGGRYLGNASRDYIADQVERALRELTSNAPETEINMDEYNRGYEFLAGWRSIRGSDLVKADVEDHLNSERGQAESQSFRAGLIAAMEDKFGKL